MTRDQLIAKAKETAEKMAKRVADAYVKSVEHNADSYSTDEYEPDEDDFFSWIEGYDWNYSDEG